MSLSATDRLEDTLDETKALLLPLDATTWVKLTVMAFFVGGLGGNGLSGNFNVGGQNGPGSGGFASDRLFDGFVQSLGSEFVIVGLVAVAILVGLLFFYVGSVMEFVLVEALVTRTASVRDRFRARRSLGGRLFAFRLALGLVVGLLVAGAFAFGLALQGPGPRMIGLILAAPVLFVVGVVAAVVYGFTTVFVVPIMFAERCGVLDGWRRLVPALRAEPTEFGVYLVLSVVLGAVGGMVVSTVVGLIGAVLFLPLGVVGFAALSSGGPLLLLVLPVLLLVMLTLAALGAVVRVPVVTYLRYYALLVLGDLTTYDLLADRPEATDPRDDGGDGTDTLA